MSNEDVIDFIRRNPPAGKFTPYVYYSKKGNSLQIYFKMDQDYSKVLTDNISVMKSVENDEIVGCRIEGIKEIMEKK